MKERNQYLDKISNQESLKNKLKIIANTKHYKSNNIFKNTTNRINHIEESGIGDRVDKFSHSEDNKKVIMTIVLCS